MHRDDAVGLGGTLWHYRSPLTSVAAQLSTPASGERAVGQLVHLDQYFYLDLFSCVTVLTAPLGEGHGGQAREE